MKVRCFADTDTAYLEFSSSDGAETRDIKHDILLDLDTNGNLVGMTIAHAKIKANLDEVSFQQLTQKAA